MLTVHHLENSRSQRVLWLLEELGVEYRIEHYKRHPETSLAPPELKRVHPLGKSPVITDGELTVAESGAIIDYLIERYGDGRLRPAPGSEAERLNRYFMYYAEGSLMPLLLMTLVFGRVKQAPWPVRPIAKAIAGKVHAQFIDPNLATHLAFLEEQLAGRTWCTGEELAGADFQMSFPLQAAAARLGTRHELPNTRALVQRIEARPAYQRAVEKGGPLEILG